ncbi:helix-turn-helix transcriptional regulator [Cellulosimicrobium funkei]|uniref:helix-turn-helix transcriptional regulator n=1 Tax=Cellulosimicrobium funkei TaxID=264251 RepID=UPI0036FEF6B3
MTLTTNDLSQRWGVSVSHLATLRSRGQGCPFMRLHGGAVRYRLADVEAYEIAATVRTSASAA